MVYIYISADQTDDGHIGCNKLEENKIQLSFTPTV